MPRVTYKLDVDHSGLRLTVVLIALVGSVLGIWLIMPAAIGLLGIPESLGCLLSTIGGIAIGIGLGWLAERGLRATWPSGRWLIIDEEAVVLQERSGETQIKWAEPVDVLSWYIIVQEGGKWVPKGWCCLACRLVQNDRIIILYAFMKPADAQTLPQWPAFAELISRKAASQRGDKHVLKQIEGQGTLRSAENDRWNAGAEMTPADFAALVTEIDRRLPDWPTGISNREFKG